MFAVLIGLMWASGNYSNTLFGTLILIGVAAFCLRTFLRGLPSASTRWWILAGGTAVVGVLVLGSWVFEGFSVSAVVGTIIVLAWTVLLVRERLAA